MSVTSRAQLPFCPLGKLPEESIRAASAPPSLNMKAPPFASSARSAVPSALIFKTSVPFLATLMTSPFVPLLSNSAAVVPPVASTCKGL